MKTGNNYHCHRLVNKLLQLLLWDLRINQNPQDINTDAYWTRTVYLEQTSFDWCLECNISDKNLLNLAFYLPLLALSNSGSVYVFKKI